MLNVDQPRYHDSKPGATNDLRAYRLIPRRRHGHRHRLAKHGYSLTSDTHYFLARKSARMSVSQFTTPTPTPTPTSSPTSSRGSSRGCRRVVQLATGITSIVCVGRVCWPAFCHAYNKQEAFEKCLAHSPLRAAARCLFYIAIHQVLLLSHAACASLSTTTSTTTTTTTTTTRDKGDRYGPVEWAQ